MIPLTSRQTSLEPCKFFQLLNGAALLLNPSALTECATLSRLLWDGHLACPNQAGKMPAPQETPGFQNFQRFADG
ncbi:MAG: hypothetical protein HC878_10315 [Leptolyngbyaceae cyanobacterium SL_5_14]|nr:hypothetical protein [Leptolyngbyaceae cyanobacterium SL_5_14]